MKPIIQLDQPLINKISAGEVVERPLNVVKELTENAIDAGASAITVEIAEGGLASIRVTDNGAGIPADQILLAFARHATSKIASLDDLFEVGTLGFRGEALSSIAAVSQVEMITKTTGAIMGVRVEIHGGQLVSRQDIGAANGTTVIVNNLFYSTPARRKFLKKPSTEAGYIADCLQKLALGNPNLAIRYINNGEITFQTSGKGDLKTAMLNIYGRETAAKLITVEAELEGTMLTGLIAKPEAARGNRQHQSFFINGRLIQSKILTQAVEEAAKTMLPQGKFPVYTLNLTVPYETVDVNVHPTKMDVRFADEDGVYKFVRGAIREALTESNLIPEVRLGARKETEVPLEQIQVTDLVIPGLPRDTNRIVEDEEIAGRQQIQKSVVGPHSSVQTRNNLGASNYKPLDPALDAPQRSLRESAPETQAQSPRFFTNYRIMGLIFGTYWLVSQDESLFLIDQHAAHERVLYEEIIEKSVIGQIQSQQLLAPVPLRLTPREASLLKDNMQLFSRFGFEITAPDGNTSQTETAVTAVPYLLKGPAPAHFFTDLLDKLGETGFSGASVYAHKTEALAMAACKAAVKAGDSLTETEAHALINKMLSLENPFTCPHGRPTTIEITRRELERRFKRS